MRLRGMAWVAALGVLALVCTPASGLAAPAYGWPGLSFRPVAAEAQSSQLPSASMLGTPGGMALDREGGTTLRLPRNLELNISFLYHGDPGTLDPKGGDASLLYNYSLNYRLLPNLQVGLSGYLFHPGGDEGFSFQRSLGERVMGLGPGLRYNLGSWNFVLKSQMETGNPKGGDLQNWFRVWYAF